LHGAFLIPAAALALGIYYLAKQFCSRPMLAALAAILTPAFLVSGTTVMCDTMMLAFWVWAVIFWLRGTKQNDGLSFLISAVLITICSLTKYFGMALLILLPVYTIMQKRKVGPWLLFLLIPAVVLAGYHWVTHIIYGRGLLLDAASYAIDQRWIGSTELSLKGLIGIAYIGGCLITVLFYIPLVWSMRFTGAIILASVILVFLVILSARACDFPISPPVGNKWSFLIQLGFMIAGGLSLLALAVEDFRKCKNAESLLLGLWIWGTFIFAGFVNWTVNARTILPMAPAMGILLMRRIDQRSEKSQGGAIWRFIWPLVPAAVIGLLATYADYTWANTGRSAAKTIQEKLANRLDRLWFQGHWGFQYYMEAIGTEAYDYDKPQPRRSDIIIAPSNNTNATMLPESMVQLAGTFQYKPYRNLSTMSIYTGAGFYSAQGVQLPYVFGPARPEIYYVLYRR